MAIDDLLDEHEQGERVRGWLRANAAGMIGGIVLGLGLIGGWQWWQRHQEAEHMRAGDAYQSVSTQLQAKDLAKAQAAAKAIPAGSTYAALAALDLAKAQVEAGQSDAAAATLRTALGGQTGLEVVVRQRLARLLIDGGKGEESLNLLGSDEDAVSLEVRGDAQSALGKRDLARDAYAKALSKIDVGAPQRRIVELKLTEAGGTTARSEAKNG